jgi:very-short-patch-repair endonuclease
VHDGKPKPAQPPLPVELLQFARKLRAEQTNAERLIWMLLRDRRFDGLKFRRQHPIGHYILDFYCEELNLAVELDGGQHNLPEGQKHDMSRSEWLTAKGIRVVRFWSHDVLGDTDTILQAIWDVVSQLRASFS